MLAGAVLPPWFSSPAQAEEIGASVLEAKKGEPEEYKPGKPFRAKGSYFLGYRFISQEDSLKAAEFVYPSSSPTFGIDMLAAPLPHRYHLTAEFLSKYDFYADAGFAYKDVLLFRDILVGLHHNLDHLDFLLPGEPPELIYVDRNQGDNYFVDFINNYLSLRLKTPNFPFHTFFKHRYVEREGRVEQRFLLGDFEHTLITSESRDIDWRSNAFTLGANSHLGPIEVEYDYHRAEFDPHGDNILFDRYPESENFTRPADVYPHNVDPETESWENTVKVHTSYTGGIVAAATLANLNKKNNYSGTESNVWKGAVDFSWIPDSVLAFFLRYRHRDVDMDNADSVTLTGLSNTLRYPVRRGISYTKDVINLSARYKPLGWLSLIPFYEYSEVDRENTAEWWVLEESSAVHRVNLTARARPVNKLKLNAIYEYRYFEDPAYNTYPDSSNQFRLNATYIPATWLNMYLDYVVTFSERDGLRYLNNDPFVLLEGGEREGRRDRLLASATCMFTPKVAATASWTYSRWDVDQDLAYGRWNMTGGGDLPFRDIGAPYTDEANSFSLGLQLDVREDIDVTADITHTISEGEYVPGDIAGISPGALISHTDIEAAETVFSLGVSKRLPRDWEIGFKLYIDIYDDKTDDLLDGRLFIGTFSLKRYF
jgi:hypothetical protein